MADAIPGNKPADEPTKQEKTSSKTAKSSGQKKDPKAVEQSGFKIIKR